VEGGCGVSEFACSVVITSQNGPDSLDRLLGGLVAQEIDARIEVIVVLDGVTAASRNVVIAWEKAAAFASFRWYEQSSKGAPSARNRGAFLARAPILLFLDDDVIPESNLISVHLRHHESAGPITVLGDCELSRRRSHSLCDLLLWSRREDASHRRSAQGQPLAFRDFCGCNVSLRREDFARVGGFEEDLAASGREDWEFGYRLLSSGGRWVTDRAARVRHRKFVTVRGALRAKRHEAHGDVHIARKYPELIRGLSLMSADDKRARRAAGLAMRHPRISGLICVAGVALLWIQERLRFRLRWHATFDVLETRAYWRGLRDSVGSMEDLRALRETALPPMRQQIDASRPLMCQVEGLNIDVPSHLVVTYDDEPIGSIELHPSDPEPLLAFIVQKITSNMSTPLLLQLARGALLQEAGETSFDSQFTETG
jgi:GT2 family glycosyltransferase